MTPEKADATAASTAARGYGLASRLLVVGVVATLLVCGVAGYLMRQGYVASVWESQADTLRERAQRIAARIELDASGVARYREPSTPDEFDRIFSGWYWQVEHAGQVLRSRSIWDAQVHPSRVPMAAGLMRAEGPRGEALVGIERRVELERSPARLEVFGPADAVDGAIRRFDRGMGVSVLILVGALVLAMVIQVRLGLRPLARLREAVTDAAQGRRERVGPGYGPDLDPLAQELDAMFARNARIVARGRGHAADLSHALKKPLTLLLAATQETPAGVDSHLVRAQVESMNRMIDRHLARSGSGAGERRRVPVAGRIEALLELMRRLHAGRPLHWHLRVETGLDWRGEPTDLDEMLGNLLDNAGKWARQRVEVDAGRASGWLRIAVHDDGPGVDAALTDRLARRGQRFDEQVEGSGLGLAISSDIADTYGGRLEFSRADLGGFAAVLWLPD